jgi:hypothetical protein
MKPSVEDAPGLLARHARDCAKHEAMVSRILSLLGCGARLALADLLET